MKVLKLSSQSPESNLITMLWEFKQDVHTEKPSHSLLQKVPQLLDLGHNLSFTQTQID